MDRGGCVGYFWTCPRLYLLLAGSVGADVHPSATRALLALGMTALTVHLVLLPLPSRVSALLVCLVEMVSITLTFTPKTPHTLPRLTLLVCLRMLKTGRMG